MVQDEDSDDEEDLGDVGNIDDSELHAGDQDISVPAKVISCYTF